MHELRGFTADDLPGAFQEAYATSKATRAKQFLFSLSLNPPPDAKVRTETFEAAIAAVEKKMGLANQPRAIVFHEKDGRRHAHAVWSRIDTERMRAVPLPFCKTKLRDLAREIYIENGWQLPPGLVTSEEQQTRQATETRERTQRFSRGFRGLWDRLTGKHAKIKQQNEQEARLSLQRDRMERDKLTFRQLEERQFLHRQIKQQRQAHREQVAELHRDVAGFDHLRGREPPSVRAQFSRASFTRERIRTHERDRGREPDFER